MLPKALGPASPAATLGFGTTLGPFWDRFGIVLGPFWGHWLKFCSTWPPQLVVFLVPEHPRKMVLLLLMAVDIICAVDMDDANTPHGVLRERGGKFGARISNLQA